jgi:hypothetical protein
MKKAMLFLATLLLSQSMVVSAASFPVTGINTVATFLDDATYFNGYQELNQHDFTGLYDVTAIAFEAGNTNEVQFKTDGNVKFTTANTNNFGKYKTLNFDAKAKNAFFTDATDGPVDIALDPFDITVNGTSGTNYFRVFELISDSNLLSYLNHQIILKAGTIIVGFGDGQGDGDFDDMILALKPVPVPAALFLFAPALLGFLGLRRKKSLAA